MGLLVKCFPANTFTLFISVFSVRSLHNYRLLLFDLMGVFCQLSICIATVYSLVTLLL